MDNFLDQIPAGLLSFTDDGTITLVNAAILQMLGYERGEIEGRSLEMLLPAGGRIFLHTYFAPRLRLRGVLDEIYMVLLAKSGAEIPVLLNAVRLERAGAFVNDCVVLSFRQRSQFESELLEARRQAELASREAARANAELEAFAYLVSHDLRAPLRAIDGFSRILQDEHTADLPEEAQEYLALVRSNTRQMGRLIDDLLAFSRLSRKPLTKQAVDTGALVRQCLAELLPERAGRQLELEIGDLAACQADPTLLKQVWLNLLTNALKYSRARSPARVTVTSRSEGSATVYSVRDNGVGFDMRYAGKLFSVFQRLHPAEEYEGTGVGLAIVQRIVHRHGGRVWAEAAVDQGAAFFFTLEHDALAAS